MRIRLGRPGAIALAAGLACCGCAADSAPELDKHDWSATPVPPKPEPAPAKLIESGHAPINGLQLWYEVYGPAGSPGLTGPQPAGPHSEAAAPVPLVLLHGGGSDIDVTFGRIIPFLAAHRRVIGVDEQGHGRSSDRDGPVTFETSADDVAALLRHLGIEQADLFGFSNGASVALQVALRHPELVRRLVFASSMTKHEGARREFWQFIANADFSLMPQPLKDAYLRNNPDPAALRRMHDKDLARMQSFPDLPDGELRLVRARTLILFGDRDLVRPEHGLELVELIPDARLLILPGGHGDWLGELVTASPQQQHGRGPELTAGLVEEFLDAP